MSDLRYDGKVAIVTGAGNGLGRSYAMFLASRGCKVVVNDLGGSVSGSGSDKGAADKVVDEIKALGGQAVANYDSVEKGENIVKTALDAFGTIDIVVNNAGILRDRTFIRMTDEDWDKVYNIHVRGSYTLTKAAWKTMREKKYGRIIFIASASGLYGNIGQSNYSAAKLALVGFSNSLAREGASHNIKSNVIAPIAGSRMTATVLPPAIVNALSPDGPAAVVALLAHDECPATGGVVEVGARWAAAVRWQRAKGGVMATTTPEAVLASWSDITDYKTPQYPTGLQDTMVQVMSTIPQEGQPSILATAVSSYTPRDVSLYALGVGATELRYTYELDENFAPLPTFAVTFMHAALEHAILNGIPGLPSFSPAQVLHGEHELRLAGPLPTSATVTTKARVADIFDKGSGTLIVLIAESEDETGKALATNEVRLFVKGLTGTKAPRGPSTQPAQPPSRPADATTQFTTNPQQAMLYRLSGDRNPLHADPQLASAVGFEKPILHGLCSLGIAARGLIDKFANGDPTRLTSVKCRFSSHVFPGDSLETDMWKEGGQIAFRVRDTTRNAVVLAGGFADVSQGPISKL